MKKIESLSTINGRKLIARLYQELRFEKQRNSISILLILWKICAYEKDLTNYINQDVEILYKLGFFKGTALWMEEVVNRYYFSAINSFVYFGAAILLVLIGLRRFSNYLSDNIVIAGVIFEAFMLMFMFIVMLFTPNEDISEKTDEDSYDESEDLINEIGEIGRDYAASLVAMEKIAGSLETIATRQNQLIEKMYDISKHTADISKPNPEMVEQMRNTNEALSDFKSNIANLNNAIESLRREEIQAAVKQELANLLSDKIR